LFLLRECGIDVLDDAKRRTAMKIGRVSAIVFLLSFACSLRAQEPAAQFEVSIAAYADGSVVPMPYSCSAQPDERGDLHGHVNPALTWKNVPQGTASFAVIFHDIDGTGAPKNGYIDSMHWLVWNIPGKSTQLAEGLPQMPELPDGTRQGTNIAKRIGYQGACGGPAGKPHHYVMVVYALDQMLDLKGGATAGDLEKAIDGHILGKSAYVGLHGR
jgi:Raf kinase inhibitor-like YbhB/YbcL family protein